MWWSPFQNVELEAVNVDSGMYFDWEFVFGCKLLEFDVVLNHVFIICIRNIAIETDDLLPWDVRTVVCQERVGGTGGE